jgi:hypothetical protein
MKIVTKGKKPAPWLGKQWYCVLCNTVVELEESDGEVEYDSDYCRETEAVYVDCPECHKTGALLLFDKEAKERIAFRMRTAAGA